MKSPLKWLPTMPIKHTTKENLGVCLGIGSQLEAAEEFLLAYLAHLDNYLIKGELKMINLKSVPLAFLTNYSYSSMNQVILLNFMVHSIIIGNPDASKILAIIGRTPEHIKLLRRIIGADLYNAYQDNDLQDEIVPEIMAHLSPLKDFVMTGSPISEKEIKPIMYLIDEASN